ncbi:serine hydrolase domain-containing protein [Zavarzinia sp. CC-PAN008]|uniref:serine hydrolase domain-containing protein n=1 Tax=Zavarzinia sp. CC-PAN008 TaxID=3243332 RepID=UPI003F747D79
MTTSPKPDSVGFDAGRLDRVVQAISADIAAERYDGAEIIVARHGTVVLHEAIGFADRANERPLDKSDCFYSMSISKQFVNLTVLQRIERGELAFTTRVADVIPEYGQKGKGRTTIADLIVHTAGLPFGVPPMPPELMGSLEAVVAATCALTPATTPGTQVSYSAVVAHAVLAEVVRRLDGGNRTYRRLLADEVFEPLGMTDSSLGARPDLMARRVPMVVRDRTPGMFDPDLMEAFNVLLTEETEIPAGGCLTTASDVFRFAEAMRRGGELDGVRVVGPALVRAATTNVTGTRPNAMWTYAQDLAGWPEIPANLGLGFFLRGEGIFPHWFGTLCSPGTFGGAGAGSNVFWVDPVSEVTFVFLSAGLLEETRNVARTQRLSDMVQASLIH